MSGWRYGGRDANGKIIKLPFTPEEEAERELRMAPQRAAHEHANMTLGPKKPGVGSLPCPRCKTGTVGYQVRDNGHMWGMCSTKGCAAWME